MTDFKVKLRIISDRMTENSCENLIWLISFLPKLAGLPLMTNHFDLLSVAFWTVHATLAFYVYIVGTAVYQIYIAEDFLDIINSYFNFYIFILIVITSCWLFVKRNDLNEVLQLTQASDNLVYSTGGCVDKYKKLLGNIRVVLLICYLFHFVNDLMIFVPSRTLDMDKFATVSCYGLEPVTTSPNQQICMAILAAQEITSIVTVGSYDVILLYLFMHTTAIFLILNEDMQSFYDIASEYDGSDEMRLTVRNYLRNLVIRHALALRTVKKLQRIYSASIGLSFGLYALSLCLFFVMPLGVIFKFASLISYCLFMFFLFCFQGQRLTTASEKFEMEVYCCGWQNLCVKEQKYVLLMLRQAQRPVILYAAGVVPIRIHTFANALQTIYKFVTVLRV